MTSYTVTATQVSNTYQGMILQVLVLDGAAAATSQPGGTGADSVGGCTVPITTTQAGSVIYGAAMCDDAASMTFYANSTPFSGSPFHDTVNANYYATWYTAATVTPGGPTDYCCSGSGAGSAAGAEILPNGTISIDASSPAVVTGSPGWTNLSCTTASFIPPGGTLLVALVPSDGSGSGQTTVSVTSSPSLTWTQLIANTGDYEYSGVWVAQVPSAPAGAPSVFYPRPANRVVTVPFFSGSR